MQQAHFNSEFVAQDTLNLLAPAVLLAIWRGSAFAGLLTNGASVLQVLGY